MRAVPGACCRPLYRTVAQKKIFKKRACCAFSLHWRSAKVECAARYAKSPFLQGKAVVFCAALGRQECLHWRWRHARPNAPAPPRHFAPRCSTGRSPCATTSPETTADARESHCKCRVWRCAAAPCPDWGHVPRRPQANRYSGNHRGRCKTLPCRPLCRAGAACTR